MPRTPRQRSTSLHYPLINVLSGIFLLSSGILAGMVLPQQAQTQTQPDTGFSSPDPTLPTPQILATLSPPQPQANPPAIDPA
ncbi:MAG: hypothetical protein Q6L68_09865, partial [Thermostichus sp. DG02_5_bins_236]